MAISLQLPDANGGFSSYALATPQPPPLPYGGANSRVAYAAAHVVADPIRACASSGSESIDWDTTIAFRRHLWDLGLGVAEAMDTAQRGMGFGWEAARELIQRSSQTMGPADRMVCGAATDNLPPGDATLNDIVAAYALQCHWIEQHNATAVVMCSRHLAATATTPDDYRDVYQRVFDSVSQRVILHWLGPMFDPALAGYWGSGDFEQACDLVVDLIHANHTKVDGIKLSLLNQDYELHLRRRLPAGVRMYTGDDFNYVDLIGGDQQGHSDALLGVFDALAPLAAAGLLALDTNDEAEFRRLLQPTVPLARAIFEAPTQYYKTGVVFLAWLNGHQDHFRMLGGHESGRSLLHFSTLFKLADQAQALRQPDLAVRRLSGLLALHNLT